MASVLLQFVCGFLYANAGEWILHKYVLHGHGRKSHGFWRYHLFEHHKICNKNKMIDPGYRRLNLTEWNTQSKEIVVLLLIVLVHLPMLWIAPVFIGAVYLSVAVYYYKHRRAHLDRDWAREYLRWHYEHHLGETQGVNWCVTWPWFDYVMGTRVKSKKLNEAPRDCKIK
jgi:sterol desaturase/sphingolipid hydroxylase (fatty acid hydroxylase superfamily)